MQTEDCAMPAALFASAFQKYDDWAPVLRREIPDLDLRLWPDAGNPADIDILLVWAPPLEALSYPNLKLVQCLGAGVDHLVSLPIPPHVSIARLIDRSQIEGFVHYVTGAVLSAHRDFHHYQRSQANSLWEPRIRVQARDRIVGVMGLGEMGAPCTLELARQGFQIRGWSRSPKTLEGVSAYSGGGGAGRLPERHRHSRVRPAFDERHKKYPQRQPVWPIGERSLRHQCRAGWPL